jgi:hypothetical protein
MDHGKMDSEMDKATKHWMIENTKESSKMTFIMGMRSSKPRIDQKFVDILRKEGLSNL